MDFDSQTKFFFLHLNDNRKNDEYFWKNSDNCA